MKSPPPPSKSAGAFVNAAPPRFDPFLRKWHVPESTIVVRALFFGLHISRTAAPNRSGIPAMDSSGLGLDAETSRLLAMRRPGHAGASGTFFARRAFAPLVASLDTLISLHRNHLEKPRQLCLVRI